MYLPSVNLVLGIGMGNKRWDGDVNEVMELRTKTVFGKRQQDQECGKKKKKKKNL